MPPSSPSTHQNPKGWAKGWSQGLGTSVPSPGKRGKGKDERGEGRGERGEKNKIKENAAKGSKDNTPLRSAGSTDAAVLHPWCVGVLIE